MPPSKQSLAIGGKWTAVGQSPHLHFEIVRVDEHGFALRCVVTDAHRHVTREGLLDRGRWLPGWQQVAAGSAD